MGKFAYIESKILANTLKLFGMDTCPDCIQKADFNNVTYRLHTHRIYVGICLEF